MRRKITFSLPRRSCEDGNPHHAGNRSGFAGFTPSRERRPCGTAMWMLFYVSFLPMKVDFKTTVFGKKGEDDVLRNYLIVRRVENALFLFKKVQKSPKKYRKKTKNAPKRRRKDALVSRLLLRGQFVFVSKLDIGLERLIC